MTSRRSASLAVFGGAALAAGADRAQAAQLSVFEAAADATIFAEQSGGTAYDAVADGRGPNLWTSVIAAGVVRRALVRFDLSALPAGAQVLSVQVEAFLIRVREPQTIVLHRITAPWSEGPANGGDAGIGAAAGPGDCTWSQRSWPSLPWANRGGDFIAAASAGAGVSGWPAPVQWVSTPALVADVQGWLNAPAGNHGWMMIGTESGTMNASRLASRDTADTSARPRLRVGWLAQAADAELPLPPRALALFGAGAGLALWRRRRG